MLNKLSMVFVGALALAMTALASPAMAFKFAPAPNTFTLSGALTLSQSITIDCVVTINVSVDAAGVATVTGRTFSPGSPLCGSVVQPFGTWTVSPDSLTQITATVGATSILGQCVGAIVGAWNNTTQTLTFTNASVPGAPNPCTVNGTLTSSDPNVRIVP